MATAASPPPGVRQLNVLGEFMPFGLIADAVDGGAGTKVSGDKYDYFLFDSSVAREQPSLDPTESTSSCDGGDHEIFIRGNRC
ncbi:hypothetical protein MLD38_002678 [Melastoma candidum]|uniref:Uncharacterized protein n=1 Tax=Melastoma candidum TaxID=119954 RepID=A0ACB9RZV6_9MYRT|nr:hypothetical protein MLD38_002678 [Melastoma candidum]